MPPMTSQGFPATVSPQMTGPMPLAKGGAAHPRHGVTVIVPLGALARSAPPAQPQPQPPAAAHPLVHEMMSIVAQTRSWVARARMTPGVNQAMFDQGGELIARGMEMLASSMPRRP